MLNSIQPCSAEEESTAISDVFLLSFAFYEFYEFYFL